jgi:uncharacterized membrane protein YdjX (TVP38/TMEM64 family)
MIQTNKQQITRFPLKPVVMLGVVALLLLLLYLSPAQKYLSDIQAFKRWLLALGWKGPVAWMGIVFILVAMGTPRLLFCPIGGLAFGFWYGLLWTQLPTLLGYYALFLFVRWGGRDFVLRHWPNLGNLRGIFKGHSATLIVFAIRQIPISGLIINFLLGLSSIRHIHFLLGSALGIMPEAIPFTLITSGTFKLNSQNTALYIAIALGLFLIIVNGLWYLYRHSKLFAQLREAKLFSINQKDNSTSTS